MCAKYQVIKYFGKKDLANLKKRAKSAEHA